MTQPLQVPKLARYHSDESFVVDRRKPTVHRRAWTAAGFVAICFAGVVVGVWKVPHAHAANGAFCPVPSIEAAATAPTTTTAKR